SVNLCPKIDGTGPNPTNGANYYVTARYSTIPDADYWLLGKAVTPYPQKWAIPAGAHIGNASTTDNGRWELTLVLADKTLSAQYDQRSAQAAAGDSAATDLGHSGPPRDVVQD